MTKVCPFTTSIGTIEVNQAIPSVTRYYAQGAAISCEAASGDAARCTVTNNPRIENASEQPPTFAPSFGLRTKGRPFRARYARRPRFFKR